MNQITRRIFIGATTLRRTVLIAAVGLVGSGALATGLDSSLTYNSRGAKWSDIQPLLHNHEVIAIQEAGPKPEQFSNATIAYTQKCRDDLGKDQDYNVIEYTWNYQTSGGLGFVYYLESDFLGKRVNAAIVIKDRAIKAGIICPQPDNTKKAATVRPILYVQTAKNKIYYTMHGGSYGDNTYNDADSIVKAVNNQFKKNDGMCWAILGDFNRDPNKLQLPSQDNVIVKTGKATHEKGGELDYMVVRDKDCRGDLNAILETGKSSDHWPVSFLTKR
jgi:hypothetical protein